MKSTLVAALVLTPLLGLAACGGDDSSGPLPEPPTTTSSSPSSPETGIITGADVPEPPMFDGVPAGIANDTDQQTCTTTPGKVTASGTVHNTADGPRDIGISVAWTAQTGNDVLARGVAELPQVGAGITKKWSVTAQLDSTVPVECVLTANRGTFAG